eukprot:5041087-Pleurochrysis_carterae.AAC.3
MLGPIGPPPPPRPPLPRSLPLPGNGGVGCPAEGLAFGSCEVPGRWGKGGDRVGDAAKRLARPDSWRGRQAAATRTSGARAVAVAAEVDAALSVALHARALRYRLLPSRSQNSMRAMAERVMSRLAKAVADLESIGLARKGDRETDIIVQLVAQRVEVETVFANGDSIARVGHEVGFRARRFRTFPFLSKVAAEHAAEARRAVAQLPSTHSRHAREPAFGQRES